MKELLDNLRYFTTWNTRIDAAPISAILPDARAKENAKLPAQTYIDLRRLILGLVGTALFYIPHHKISTTRQAVAFNPRRAQSDSCANLFSRLRGHTMGGNPTPQQAHAYVLHEGAKKLTNGLAREDGGKRARDDGDDDERRTSAFAVRSSYAAAPAL
mmetsp:Transcript_8569/g.22549  ORF Transcript_8569/g.22549 Transcript_8569/m.22549 type:complete len:158 (+) Transcript_8569:331-804(+)